MTQTIGAAALPRDPRWSAPTDAGPALASAPLDPRDQATIDRTIARIRATESGREVGDFLAAGRVDIKVFDDAEFSRRFPGAGAIYDPRTRDIVMPRRVLGRDSLVTTLAHEGKHALDFSDRPHWFVQSAQLIGGTVGDGAKALVTFQNPVTAWLDSLTARQNENEVNAYHLQAQVAHELGRNESSWALGQARDGTPLPLDEVRANVATNDLYRMSPGRRLLLGGSLGIGITSIGAYAVQAAAAKLRPNSYLANHAWPLYAVGGAMTAAWVLGDQLRARRLESGSATL